MHVRTILVSLIAFVLSTINPLFVSSKTHLLPSSMVDSIVLPLSGAQVLITDVIVDKVVIVDPYVVDAKMLSDTQMILRAKQIGKTSVLIWEKGGAEPSKYNIVVTPDLDLLEAELKAIDERIKFKYIPAGRTSISDISIFEDESDDLFSAQQNLANKEEDSRPAPVDNFQNGRIVLMGTVSHASAIASAVTLAGAYIGDSGIEIITRKGGTLMRENIEQSNSNGNSGGSSGSGSSGASSFSSSNTFQYSNKQNNLSYGSIVVSSQRKVVSYLEVDKDPQIIVSIKFFEISKSITRTLEVSGFIDGTKGTILHRVSSINEIPNTTQIFQFRDISAFLNYWENRGDARSLAEPTLVVTNGEPASFLAGGEAPIVVSIATGAQAQQSVRFEPFGIKLDILATILANGKIHMHVVPEIRNIDRDLTDFFADSSALGGGVSTSRPPAFATRRTETQVTMEANQSLVLSGLLDSQMTQSAAKTPVLGSIPILGSLLKSKNFVKGETELFVVITPTFAEAPNNIASAKEVAEINENRARRLGVQAREFRQDNSIKRKLTVDKSPSLLVYPDSVVEKVDITNEASTGQYKDVEESNMLRESDLVDYESFTEEPVLIQEDLDFKPDTMSYESINDTPVNSVVNATNKSNLEHGLQSIDRQLGSLNIYNRR